MNDQTPETTVQTESKPRLWDRLTRSNAPVNVTSKPKSTFVEKAKTAAAIVGVVTVVGVVAAIVTKSKSATVEVTLPDVDITTVEA